MMMMIIIIIIIEESNRCKQCNKKATDIGNTVTNVCNKP